MAWPMTGTMFVDIKERWWMIFFERNTYQFGQASQGGQS